MTPVSFLYGGNIMNKTYRHLTPVNLRLLLGLTASLATVGVANAQDSDSALEEIVVKGYRSSVAAALEAKRDSVGAVDSIMAEDIADFPDQNLAESLQRIPGVAISRDGGEGRQITVRGLNPSFTRVQVNGMDAQSLSGGIGGITTSRSVDFNVFASDLFNRIDVHKSTSAEMEEGSLGAIVDLHTGRPLDYDPMTVALNVQGGYNDLSSELRPRGAALFSFSNEDQTLGALVSVAYSDRGVASDGPQTARWEDSDFGSCSACVDQAEFDAVTSAFHPRIPRYDTYEIEQDRLGITGSFQWKPGDATLLTVDVMHAEIDSNRGGPFFTPISLARSGGNGVGGMDVLDFSIDNSNNLITGSFSNVDIRSEFFDAQWGSTFDQYGLTLEHEFNDKLRLKFAASTSESDLDNTSTTVIYEHYNETDDRRNVDYADLDSTLSYDYTNMTAPIIGTGYDLTDPANWEVSEFRSDITIAESTNDGFKLDVAYDLNDQITLKAGATRKEYAFDTSRNRANRAFNSADEQDGVIDQSACGIGAEVTAAMGTVATNSAGLDYFAPDIQLTQQFLASGCWPYAVRAGDTRDVEEDVLSYYVQFDFETELYDRAFRGNLGVKEVETEVASTGIVNGTNTVTVGNEYSDTLPAINLSFDVTDDVVLRASWAKVMSRPSLSLLSPGGSVGTFGTPRVTSNNPFLEPFRADALDLAVEWYFDEAAILSLAYFDKDIESFPERVLTSGHPWSSFGLPDSLLGAQIDNVIDQPFESLSFINGRGGDLSGWELQYQQQMTFLPGPEWVRQFGVLANYTSVDSEVFYGDRVGPLLGQSDDSSNFTLYWEGDSFAARVSVANRSEYFTRLSDDDPQRWIFAKPSTYVDLSASYQISDQVKLTFEAINVTDEPVGLFIGEGIERVNTNFVNGVQYFVGFTYRP